MKWVVIFLILVFGITSQFFSPKPVQAPEISYKATHHDMIIKNSRAPAVVPGIVDGFFAGNTPGSVYSGCTGQRIDLDTYFNNPEPLILRIDSVQELTSGSRLHQETWQRALDPTQTAHTLGLTSPEQVMRIGIEGVARRFQDHYCYIATHIHYEFGMRRFNIAIAREIEPGSCLDQEVMAHEMRHARATRTEIERTTQRLKKLLNLLSNRGLAVEGVSAAQAQQQALDYIEGIGRKELDDMEARLRVDNQQIDTKDEYERMGEVCNRAAPQLIHLIFGYQHSTF